MLTRVQVWKQEEEGKREEEEEEEEEEKEEEWEEEEEWEGRRKRMVLTVQREAKASARCL
jgi:hypothetical protein